MTTTRLLLVPHAAPPGAEPAGPGAFVVVPSTTTAMRRVRREG
nr:MULTISPECIES: hypothetical protein [unclassified Acidovorax]